MRMKLPPSVFQRRLSVCAWLVAAIWFTGCSHLYYADPNPPTPFAFPGQPPAPQQVASLDPRVPSGVSSAPVPATRSNASDMLRVGDNITVSFSDIPAPGILPVTQRIREDGRITLPFNVILVAAGKTVGQLQEEIRNAYVPSTYRQMTPSVKTEERVFFVDGEVKLPGRLPYLGEMTVLRAITSAQGFTDFAKRKKVELRRASGQKLIINWYKAIADPNLDPAVFPNDQIIVHRRIW